MGIDAGIYGNLKQIAMPSLMDSQTKAANLSSIGMQQQMAMKKDAREDDEYSRQDKLRKAQKFGESLEAHMSLSPEQQAKSYPQWRESLLSEGVTTPEVLGEQYDPGQQVELLSRWRSTADGINHHVKLLDMKKTEAEIRALDRKGTASDDPLARQMAMADYKDQLDQKKKQREMQQYSQVGGWKLSDGATPTQSDAKLFKEGAADARQLLSDMNEYQDLLGKYGAETGGKIAQRMDSLATGIQLKAKSPAMLQLGVLTGPDLDLLKTLIEAPTGAGSFFNPMAGSKANTKADEFRAIINRGIGAKARTYGFEPTKEWETLAANIKEKTRKDVPPGIGTPRLNAGDKQDDGLDDMPEAELRALHSQVTGGR